MKFEIRKFDPGGIQKTEGEKSFKTEAKFRALIQTLARIYFGCLFEWIPKSKLIRREMYTWKTYKKNTKSRSEVSGNVLMVGRSRSKSKKTLNNFLI